MIRCPSSPSRSTRDSPGPLLSHGAALAIGLFVAAMGHPIGAYLLISGLLLQLSLDVLVGVASYRDVMNRPWPDVTPLDEDDDW